MSNNKGFTLIELVISSLLILIVSIGFFAWSTTVIHRNLAMGNNNTAYDMAMDIGDRLSSMPDNALVLPDTGNEKYVGFAATGQLFGCLAGSPTIPLVPTPAVTKTRGEGLTIYTDPFFSAGLYLYDSDACCSTSNPSCSISNPYCLSNSLITASANTDIDHPNDVSNIAYDNLRPVRFINNTTFYAVWSVGYLPCATIDTDRRKIFVTVYWMDPEPTDSAVSDVNSKITAGTYNVNSVSIVIDKAIGIE